jgi:hypothetical protein
MKTKISFKLGVSRTKLSLWLKLALKIGSSCSPPVYSTHLSLPYNHSSNILKVTKNKKITILITKPLDHITIGVTDIIINSKSKIKKIIQKIKNRKETGKTLTLKESNPHSNVSDLIILELTKNLIKPITTGTKTEIKKYINITHINTLINK